MHVVGATTLLEAIHFIETNNHTHFEVRGARSSSGTKHAALSAATVALVQEALDAIEHELAQLDDESSVRLRDIVYESIKRYHHSFREVRAALQLALVYVLNLLKHPNEAKYWHIRAKNKTFGQTLGMC